MDERTSINDLPQDVLSYILIEGVMLQEQDQKHLVKYRLVCKAWDSIILTSTFFGTSGDFVSFSYRSKAYLYLVNPLVPYALNLLQRLDDCNRYQYMSQVVDNKECVFSNSCRVILCDITTAKLSILAGSSIKDPKGAPSCSFGSDPSKGQYKILRLWVNCRDVQCEVLTLANRSHKWRQINSITEKYCTSAMEAKQSICINGVIYWGANLTLVAFIVKDETFRIIEPPVRLKACDNPTELRGKPALAIKDEIWILEDLQEQRWIKSHYIYHGFVPTVINRYEYFFADYAWPSKSCTGLNRYCSYDYSFGFVYETTEVRGLPQLKHYYYPRVSACTTNISTLIDQRFKARKINVPKTRC